MKAVRWHARGDVRIDDVPEPVAGPGEVLIRVAACGICGSDLGEYRHGPMLIPGTKHPLTGKGPPIGLGHEFSGRVVEAGANVDSTLVGRRVTVNPCLVCGDCPGCRSGQPNYCLRLGSIGLSLDGAMAPFVVAPAYGLHPLPDAVDDEQGSFVEPLAVVLHTINRSKVTAEEPVAVVGAGPIGLLLIQALRAGGVERIIAIEPRSTRRDLALQLGATDSCDPTAEDPGRAVARLLGPERASVAFECVGSEAGLNTALRTSGRGGRVLLVGLVAEPVPVNFLLIMAHEKSIVGSSAYVDEFPEAIRLLAENRVDVRPLITECIAVEDALTEGFEALLRPDNEHIKILVKP